MSSHAVDPPVDPARLDHAVTGGRRLTETAIAGLGWTSLAMGLQAVLQMVALILLARLLSPQEFGLFAAALVIGGFCAIFSELGVGPAIVQRPVLSQSHVRSGFTLSVALSLAAGAVVFLSADAIAGFFQMPALAGVVRVMALGFPLQGISTVAQSLALRRFRFRWLALVEGGTFALGFVVVAPLLTLRGFGIYALVGAYLTQHFSKTVLLLAGQPHAKLPLLHLKAVRELLFFGAGFTLARIGNYFATQADNLVVGRWLGATPLGLYSHAYQLMASPAMLVGQALDRVLFPTLASVQSEPQRLVRAYRSGVFFTAAITLPGGILVAVLAPEIVLILLGPKWTDVAIPLRILALAMLFRTSYKMSDTVVRAMGAVYARAWRQAIFAGAVFGFALVGQRWGLAGVAFGVFLALALNFTLMAQLSLRLIGMRWREFGVAHVPAIILALAVGSLAAAVSGTLREAGAGAYAVVAGTVPACAVLVLGLVWLWPNRFLGPDRVQLMRALSRLAPSAMRRGIGLLQKRVAP